MIITPTSWRQELLRIVITGAILIAISYFIDSSRNTKNEALIELLNMNADHHKARADSLEKLIPALRAKQQTLRDTITIVQNQRDVHYDTYIQVLDSINRAPYLTPEFQQCRAQWRQLIQDGFLTKRLRSR